MTTSDIELERIGGLIDIQAKLPTAANKRRIMTLIDQYAQRLANEQERKALNDLKEVVVPVHGSEIETVRRITRLIDGRLAQLEQKESTHE